MLAPAVHIMHQVWRGMAWVAEGMDEEEDGTKSYDVEQVRLTERGRICAVDYARHDAIA